MNEPATVDNSNQVAAPPGYGEVSPQAMNAAGFDAGRDSYLDKFKYQLRMMDSAGTLGLFCKEEEVGRVPNGTKVVIFYWHPVLRLRVGAHKGLTGSYRHWPKDDQAVLAQCYDEIGSSKPGAQGSFAGSEYQGYLTLPSLREKLERRNYMFIAIPEITKGEIVACTFGSVSGIYDVVKTLKAKNFAPAQVFCELKVQQAKLKDSNDSFPQVHLDLVFENGHLKMSTSDAAGFEERIAPRVAGLKQHHLDFMSFASGGGSVSPVGSTEQPPAQVEAQPSPQLAGPEVATTAQQQSL